MRVVHFWQESWSCILSKSWGGMMSQSGDPASSWRSSLQDDTRPRDSFCSGQTVITSSHDALWPKNTFCHRLTLWNQWASQPHRWLIFLSEYEPFAPITFWKFRRAASLNYLMPIQVRRVLNRKLSSSAPGCGHVHFCQVAVGSIHIVKMYKAYPRNEH